MRARNPYQRIVHDRWTSVFLIVGYFVWFLLTELGPMAIPGGLGGMLWIPFHFIINPWLALGVVPIAVAHAFFHKGTCLRLGIVLSGAAILFVAWSNFTGEIWLVEMMGIDFRG